MPDGEPRIRQRVWVSGWSRSGPPWADVSQVVVVGESVAGEYRFSIR